jgi:hypothetical protein
MWFLIDYDRRAGKLEAIREFGDAQRREAEEARLALELQQRSAGIEHEVVLLDAANESALRKTHRRYFESLEEMITSTSYSSSIADKP